MKSQFSGKKKLLSILVLSLAQGVLAADEETDLGIPYEVVLPDSIIQDAFPDEEFGDIYTQVKADRVAGADVDEALYPVTKPDQYSGGTSDPETVYREMGENLDTEMMVVTEPGKDPEKMLPEPTVVAFDGYSGREVTITFASQINLPSISTEERIFLLINQPAAIDRERRRLEKQQQRSERVESQRKRARVSVPSSSPVEVINAN